MTADVAAPGVYVLCSIASILCMLLLLRSYRSTRERLVFLLALCFAGLAMNSVLLTIDLVVFTWVDLSVLRGLVALAAVGSFLLALIWEAR